MESTCQACDKPIERHFLVPVCTDCGWKICDGMDIERQTYLWNKLHAESRSEECATA